VVRRPSAVLSRGGFATLAFAVPLAAFAYFLAAPLLPALPAGDTTILVAGSIGLLLVAASALAVLPAYEGLIAPLLVALGAGLLVAAFNSDGTDGVGAGANVAEALLAGATGLLFARWLAAPAIAVAVPLFVAVVDILSVAFGPTSRLLDAGTGRVDALSFDLPAWGDAGSAGHLGFSDAFFIALFAAWACCSGCSPRSGSGSRWTAGSRRCRSRPPATCCPTSIGCGGCWRGGPAMPHREHVRASPRHAPCRAAVRPCEQLRFSAMDGAREQSAPGRKPPAGARTGAVGRGGVPHPVAPQAEVASRLDRVARARALPPLARPSRFPTGDFLPSDLRLAAPLQRCARCGTTRCACAPPATSERRRARASRPTPTGRFCSASGDRGAASARRSRLRPRVRTSTVAAPAPPATSPTSSTTTWPRRRPSR
jgi:hypothetical protein